MLGELKPKGPKGKLVECVGPSQPPLDSFLLEDTKYSAIRNASRFGGTSNGTNDRNPGRFKPSPMFTSEGCTFLDLAISPRVRSCDCDRSRGYSSLSARDRVTGHADGDRSMDCDRSRCMDRCRVDCDRSMDCDRSRGGSTTCMACHPNMTLNIDRH